MQHKEDKAVRRRGKSFIQIGRQTTRLLEELGNGDWEAGLRTVRGRRVLNIGADYQANISRLNGISAFTPENDYRRTHRYARSTYMGLRGAAGSGK